LTLFEQTPLDQLLNLAPPSPISLDTHKQLNLFA